MEGRIMPDIRVSSLGGIPKGNTSARPSNPNIGDPYYNGQTGVLEIYTSSGWQVCSAVPGAPTIGTATAVAASTRSYASGGSVSVPFTAAENGGFPTTYVVTASPGGLFNSGSSSPIAVSGLTAGTAYTFSVAATNGFGNSVSSASSNSITPQTLPQAPTIGTASAVGTIGNVELTFTAGNAGGSSITNYKYSTDGTTYTAFSPAQTTSPLTISGLPTGVSTTISIKAVTANGDSLASSVSGGAGNNGGGAGVGATSGVNSTFTGGALSLTAAVGGGGAGGGWTGSGNGTNAKSGGSGGGGEMRYGVGGANVLDTGGAPTSGQGNAGGNGGLTSTSPNLKYCCGGGGGAGSAGGNANATSASGNGGNGTSAYSAWGAATSSGVNVSGTYYYAAASGGAAGGSAGSANSTNGIGFSSTLATNINTGNGGFGSQSSIGDRIGNSGIIIVRYQ